MKKKGKIKTTGIINLCAEANPIQFELVFKNLVKDFRVTGLVTLQNDEKGKLTILTEHVWPFDRIFQDNGTRVKHENPELLKVSETYNQLSKGIERINDFRSNYVNKDAWFLFGKIEGSDTPIMIIYYTRLGVAIYSVKTEAESIENFFPPILAN